MRAAVLKEFGKPLSVEEVAKPTPGEEEVLVKVMACGVDGTDLKLMEGFGYRPDLPFISGHEPAGYVEAIGSRVDEIELGARVITHNFQVCGRCAFCRNNRANICPHMTGVLGVRGLPGGHADYFCIPARQLVPFPESVDWADAAVLVDAGITAYHAIDRSGIKLGESVLIIGVGGVGSYAIQFAKLAGARVIAVDIADAKVNRALKLGADEVVHGGQENVPEKVRQLTEGWGVECVVDIVGMQKTMGWGIDSLANGGRLVIVGYTPEEYPLSGKQIAQNELQVIGSRCGRQQDLIKVVELVASGKTQTIVTDRLPFERINDALAMLREGKVLGRLVLEIDS